MSKEVLDAWNCVCITAMTVRQAILFAVDMATDEGRQGFFDSIYARARIRELTAACRAAVTTGRPRAQARTRCRSRSQGAAV